MTTPIDSCKPITPLKGFKYPYSFITFDTESYIINEDGTLVEGEQNIEDIESYETHKLRLGVCIFNHLNKDLTVQYNEVFYFRTSIEFWDYVERKNRVYNNLFIYAHNAKYDTLNVNIIDELNRLGYDTPFPTINNAFIINSKKGKKRLHIVDTFNYAKTSVEKMGEKLGIEKIKLGEKGKIDFNAVDDKTLFKYCEQDVRIVEQWLISFFRFLYNNGDSLGSVKYTAASTSLDVYRHKFIEGTIYYHRNDNILRVERAAYRGGIVECFKLGKLKKQKYYLLDINSMYVNVMSKELLPVFPILYIEKLSIEELKDYIQNNYCVADVLLCVENNYGKFGLKYEGKLIFPVGEYRVTLHQQEIISALKEGYITNVFLCVLYHTEKALSKYANYFSELKKKANNKTDYDLAKLFGNGLYGKFGMRKYITRKAKLNNLFDLEYEGEDKEIQDEIKISDKSKEELKSSFKPTIMSDAGIFYYWNGEYILSSTDDFIHVPRTNVALAGSVTAYARILLSKYIEICGYKNIYYSDTDSMLVNEDGYRNLLEFIDDKELGYLKVEFVFNGGNIKAPKNYTFVEKRKLKIKIIKKKIKLDFNKILTKLKKSIILKRRDRSKGIPLGSVNHNGTYEYMRFTTFKEFLKSGGELKGRIKAKRKNSLIYTKGDSDNQDKYGNTKPYMMQYICKDEKWTNKIIQ